MAEDDEKGTVGKAILFGNEVEELCEECRAKVDTITKQEGKQRLLDLQIGINPLDGFSIIGNQLISLPGVSSIRKMGSELPYTMRKKKWKKDKPPSS